MYLPYGEISRVYHHLGEVKATFGPNPHRPTRAIVLIGACISNNFNTRHLIIKGCRVTGLSVNHVTKLLDEHTGDLWRRDDEGVYHLLDPV